MITLQNITEEDFDDIYKMTKKKSIMKFIGDGKVWDKEKVKKFIHYNLEEQGQNRNQRKNYYYKIVFSTNKEDTFIGIIGVHTMKGRKGFYLTSMIEKEYQGMGYYREALELLKEVLKRERIKTDRLKSLVRKSNKRMNEIRKKHYYFNEEIKFNGEEFNEYFIFLRKLTYLVKTDYLRKKEIYKILNDTGFWEQHSGNIKIPVDFLHIDGKYYWDKSLYKIKSKLKNLLNINKDKVTDKRNLHKNLIKIKSMKKHLMITHDINMKKYNYEKYFDGEKLWLIKPVSGYAGKGIELLDNYEDFLIYFENTKNLDLRENQKNDFILQEYITNPLLYNGKKFHLRCHFLAFEGEGWFSSEMPTYTAGKKFKLDDFKNQKIHDSHYEDSEKDIYFPSSFKLSKKIKLDILEQIKKIFSEVLKLLDFSCWEESKKCYQLFGADFMITEDFRVIILEVNDRIGLKGGDVSYFPGTRKRYINVLFETEILKVVNKIFPPENKLTDDESHFIKI